MLPVRNQPHTYKTYEGSVILPNYIEKLNLLICATKMIKTTIWDLKKLVKLLTTVLRPAVFRSFPVVVLISHVTSSEFNSVQHKRPTMACNCWKVLLRINIQTMKWFTFCLSSKQGTIKPMFFAWGFHSEDFMLKKIIKKTCKTKTTNKLSISGFWI